MVAIEAAGGIGREEARSEQQGAGIGVVEQRVEAGMGAGTGAGMGAGTRAGRGRGW